VRHLCLLCEYHKLLMQVQIERCIPGLALCANPGQHVLLPVRSRPNMFVVDPLSGFQEGMSGARIDRSNTSLQCGKPP
jgi:hypothetical protein